MNAPQSDTPTETTVEAATNDDTPSAPSQTWRARIIAVLDGMDSVSLNRIILRLEGASKYVGDEPSYYNRIYALMAYVESSTGPGLSRLAKILCELFPHIADQFPESVTQSNVALPELLEKPREHMDIPSLVLPGGTLAYDSAFYIQRAQFDMALNRLHIKDDRQLVTLKGARQTGKSTFIGALLLESQKRSELRTVFVDFQSLSKTHFASVNALWFAIAGRIASALEMDDWEPERWSAGGDTWQNMTTFLRRYLFKHNTTPVLLCFDEIDRAVGTSAGPDFFSLIRAFYNEGANGGNWRQVRWLLATSTEPSAFIDDVNVSPFNVGLPIPVNAFTSEEIEELIRRHRLQGSISSDELLQQVGGRPFLTHSTLYHLAIQKIKVEEFWEIERQGNGVFRTHLERYWEKIQADSPLCKALCRVVRGYGCEEMALFHRLEALGLVVRDATNNVVPSCLLYKEYFQRRCTEL